jgi:hypothetical protein
LPLAITTKLLSERQSGNDSAPPSAQLVETPAALAKLKFFSAPGHYVGQDEGKWDMRRAGEQTAS